uniref:helix-turn-helix domain-containing protein n=1 Tax=Bifidobacterium longum TaxID=216816 RepID=UPI001F3D45D4
MGEVYSHLSEEERQVIQIEVGNGASIRGIGAMLGRSPSSISREIKRNTWFPSNENESYRPYRPKKTEGGAMDRPLLHRRARAAQGRPQEIQATKSPTGCRTTACGRRWPNGWAAAGRRCSSAAGCASCGRTMRSCACARRP